jgi:hypothetical protein
VTRQERQARKAAAEARQERVERFAVALRSTSARYLAGCMSKPTWKSHMGSLWGQVESAGLREQVESMVDPAMVGLRPFGEQRL